MRFPILGVLALFTLTAIGCSFFEPSKEVLEAKKVVKAAVADAEKAKEKLGLAEKETEAAKEEAKRATDEAESAKTELAETIKGFNEGNRTEAEVEASRTKYNTLLTKADNEMIGYRESLKKQDQASVIYHDAVVVMDERHEDLKDLITIEINKYDKLAEYGASAGSIFGPQGKAIGAIVGMIGAGIMALLKTRTLNGLTEGIQVARAKIHETNPELGKKMDDEMKKAIPIHVKKFIKKQKSKERLDKLAA